MIRAAYILSIILLILFKTSASAESDENAVYIYYVPFDLTTFAPFDRNEVKKLSFCTVSIPPKSFVIESLEHITKNSKSGTFDEGQSRMIIQYPDKSELKIDREKGIYFSQTEESRVLSQGDFNVVYTIVELLCKDQLKGWRASKHDLFYGRIVKEKSMIASPEELEPQSSGTESSGTGAE